MAKFLALARATFSEGMQLFAYRSKADAARWQKLALPLGIAALIMFSMGCYAYQLLTLLSAAGLTQTLPALIIAALSLIGLLEGIYKVPGLLFSCRDDDLLFSLPIPRRHIFAMRVLKLVVFQLLFNALFALPVFVVYAAFVQPGFSFYFISFLMLFLIPLLPTSLAVFIGYLVKRFSIRFRHQKVFQLILTLAALALVMLLVFNAESLVAGFMGSASAISGSVAQVYYPAAAYSRLIQSFNLADFCGLLAISILPFLAIIYLCSRSYFRIISQSKISQHHSRVRPLISKSHSATASLVKKDITRYFSSTVFVVNTMVGPILLLIATIGLALSGDNLASIFAAAEEVPDFDIYALLPTLYTVLLMFSVLTTSITSSAISIEGKSFNITKSLPISPAHILAAKVLAAAVIITPALLIADAIFLSRFATGPLDFITIIALSFLLPLFSGLLGLLINLKYPKMTALSDTEVVKQSASSMLAVFAGLGATIICSIIAFALGQFINVNLILLLLFAALDLLFWHFLRTWGAQKFRQINV